jgi:hypothetical protein
MSVRSLRNNNPGNIRIGTNWQGLLPFADQSPDQKAEHDFCVFKSPVWGFRAMTTILLNYQRRDGLKTLRQAISRWAPPEENDTDAYVRAVANVVGVNPDEPLNWCNEEMLTAMVKAIAIHEAGSWIWITQDAQDGVLLALG